MTRRPDDALPILSSFAPAFTPATFCRAGLRGVAAIRTTGRRTVSNLLRTLGHLAQGAPSSYQRVLSCARWSGLCLAALLTRLLRRRYWSARTVTLVGDDTVTEHPQQEGPRQDAAPRRCPQQPPLHRLALLAPVRSYLGLETTRGRCAKTVLRGEPMLFGLYAVVTLLDEELPQEAQAGPGVEWEGKASVTFSDAITAVRRWLWTNWACATGGHEAPFTKLPAPLPQTLLDALAPAAWPSIRILRVLHSQEKST